MARSKSPPSTEAPRSFGVAALATIAGLALVVFGWLIPSQFKSLPVSILAEAGRESRGLAAAVQDEIDAGRPGVAATYAQAAAAVKLPDAALLKERVAQFAAENPDLALWGEANHYLTSAVSAEAVRALDPTAGVIRHFIPAATRRALLGFLRNSRNASTRAILATRDLPTYRQFLPVVSAGGAPLEATVLLAAMLVQSEEFGSEAARELRALAEEAVRTGEAAKIEQVYLDFLALGRRYTWGQLAAIVRQARTLETLARIRHLHQIAPESGPVVGAAAMLSQQPDAVAEYLIHFGPRAVEALAFALYHGHGSLDLLLRQQLPPDGELALPPAANAPGLARAAIDPLVRFALHRPYAAVLAKFVAYLLGGLLLFLAAERVTALRRIELARLPTNAARAIGAMMVCLFLVLINEPYLALGSEPSGYELKLVIPLLGAATAQSMPSTSFSIDLPTILSIVFFFLLQAFVYVICMLKLREIEGRGLPPLVKLRLTENEENLFDSGLYVGIAGTCCALVLQVLHVIEANLLAAYSSNLFGILGVAFIKIRHVRPFKHRLILQAEAVREGPPPAASVGSAAAEPARAG